MHRSILFLMLGIFCSAVLVSALSAYVFHDVDHSSVDNLNRAFAGLCAESVAFALIVGAATASLTFLGQLLLHSKNYPPRATLGLVLGISVPIAQYAWDFTIRKLLPSFADANLLLLLVILTLVCAAVLLRDSFRQRQLHLTPPASKTTHLQE